MAQYYERHDCRFCGSKNLTEYVDLGDQPPSNSFIEARETSSEKSFPLKVSLCQDCGLSQLQGVVSADSIFNEYQYLSSTSKALVNHYGELTKYLVKRFNVAAGSAVMDIGCNDGIMLNGYATDLKRVGVEPSQVAEIAKSKGHQVYNDFFTVELARKIRAEQGPMRIITATNVFAHIDDIHSVVDGIAEVLSDDGAFVIEAPYVVDTVDQVLFDTIYHEHLCYLGVTPLVKLMDRHGLEVFDVERINFGASGPAIRVFTQKKGGAYAKTEGLLKLVEFEKEWGICGLERYRDFSAKIQNINQQLNKMLNDLRSKGARIGAYGAPAKGNTLLNTFRITSEQINEGVAETNKMKQGKLTPGSHLKVVSEEDFMKAMPDYALLLTWNYLDFFLKNSEYIKRGGKFITPLPHVQVLP